MSRNVLEKDPLGFDFADDAGNVWPEVARIVFALALSCGAERLAGVSGKHGVDDAAPWPAAEPLEVVPDRCSVKISGCLGGGEDGSGVVLDLDEAGGGKARLGKSKAHVKATAARTEGETVSGR